MNMAVESELHPITVLQYLALIHQVTYTNVCREVGLTPQQFSDWVKKRRPVPKERLHALADFFKVDIRLLIDDNHYLKDLTPEVKVDVQILFLDRMLKKEGEDDNKEGYQEKLEQLQWEKRRQALISRFAALLEREHKENEEICLAFVNLMERGSSEVLHKLLHEEGRNL